MASINKRISKATGRTSYFAQVRIKTDGRQTVSKSKSFQRLSNARAWASAVEADLNRDEILPEAVKHWVSDAIDKIDKYLETVEKLPGGRQAHLYCRESPAMISEAVSFGESNVEVIPLHALGVKNKVGRMVQSLADDGCLHLFDGTLGTRHRKINLSKYLEKVSRLVY